MWNLTLTKKDFIEFWLGGNRKVVGMASERHIDPELTQDFIQLQWETQPSAEYFFPTKIIGSEADIKSILTSLNSSPSAATPVSAYSRVLTTGEYKYFKIKSKATSLDLTPIVAMAMAECALLSEERFSWKQISLAACVKTLSYTWGKAMVSGDSPWIIEDLPVRWFQTLSILNSLRPGEQPRRTISAANSALNAYLRLTSGAKPTGYPGALAEALYRKDRNSINVIWLELARRYGFDISLDSLALSTREERASYLQQALKFSANIEDDDTLSALCAFIATQVAPGSLEHLDLLRSAGSPEIVFWYALYAALVSPAEILAIQGGIGYRIYKMMNVTELKSSAPLADICFAELKILERAGIDTLSKKTSGSGELQVELLPFVTASFNYNSIQSVDQRYDSRSRELLEAEYRQASKLNHDYRMRVEQAISLLAGVVNEPTDSYTDPYYARRMGTRKKPSE